MGGQNKGVSAGSAQVRFGEVNKLYTIVYDRAGLAQAIQATP
jgi:hypothetical protein